MGIRQLSDHADGGYAPGSFAPEARTRPGTTAVFSDCTRYWLSLRRIAQHQTRSRRTGEVNCELGDCYTRTCRSVAAQRYSERRAEPFFPENFRDGPPPMGRATAGGTRCAEAREAGYSLAALRGSTDPA